MSPNDFAVAWVDGAIPDGDHYRFMPCFRVTRGNEHIGTVWVRLTGTAEAMARTLLTGVEDVQEALNRILIRAGANRIARELAAGVLFEREAEVQWSLGSDDVDDLMSLQEKLCSYQVADDHDLFCSAASQHDTTVVGTIGRRRIAPTARPICQRCTLPDTDYLCSHLLHPEVTSVRGGGLHERRISSALCDLGRDEVQQAAQCRAGGNSCWQMLVAADRPKAPEVSSPLTLVEAFDFLDAVWRLVFGRERALLSLSTIAEPVGLVGTCDNRDSFEARMSDLADILDRLTISDELLPNGTSDQDRLGSLNRLSAVLNNVLEAESADRANVAVVRLRNVRHVRNALQHSGAARDLPKALAAVGLRDPMPPWSQVWDELRAVTTEALLVVRTELRRLV